MTEYNPAELPDAKTIGSSGGLDAACPYCHRLNEPASKRCASCGERLRSSCRHCGHANPRGAKECIQCGRALHVSTWRRWRRKLLRKRGKVKPIHVVLLIIVVFLIGYWLPRVLTRFETEAHSGADTE